MVEKFKYEFDVDTGILYKYYYGKIKIKDIRESWEYAFVNNIIPEGTRGFILDFRSARMDFQPGEISGIPDFYQEHIEIFRNSKIAIITTNPEDVIKPALVQEKDRGYLSRPFSTVEAAVDWILS